MHATHTRSFSNATAARHDAMPPRPCVSTQHAFCVIADMIATMKDERRYPSASFSQPRPPSVRRRVALVRSWHDKANDGLTDGQRRSRMDATANTSKMDGFVESLAVDEMALI